MCKLHVHLQTMHKTPAKFHKDLTKMVGVVLSKYPLIVSEMPKND